MATRKADLTLKLCWLPNGDADWAGDTTQKIIAPKNIARLQASSKKKSSQGNV